MLKRILILFTLLSLTVFAQFPNVRVSGEPFGFQPEEVTIAINPVNPLQLAAGANINYFFGSSDGGQTWSQLGLESSLGVWGDPVVVYDTEGQLYFSHLSNPQTGGYWIDRIVVQKSTDNGLTWDDGKGIGYTAPRNQDKEWMAVDHTNSQYRNNVYMCWTEFDSYGSDQPNDSSRILFSRTTDAGASWSDPVVVSDSSGNCIDSDHTTEGAVPAVGPEGQIYTAWSGPLGLLFDKSYDGGETWGEDIFISDLPGGWAFSIPGINRANGFPVTACDISDSEYRGTVYVMWSDQRNGTNNTDIWLKKSTDEGETWLEKVKVNDDATERHQFFHWMCVDSTSGYLYAVFYDRRNTIGNVTDVYMARSTDGGETFENFKISESSFKPHDDVFFGDYICIAAHQGKVYPIWQRMDNRVLTVWTALFDEATYNPTNLTETPQLVSDYKLYPNYPNPFNPNTTISYSIPEDGFVKLEIYDVLGKLVEKVVSQRKSAGTYEYTFDASDLPSGIYVYNLQVNNYSESQKMILLK